ncbi:MAG: hypothetical protein K0B02_03330 [DPANN group archaeon]|nr:hypothetical protein [DPANN group archaeon]
MDSYPGEGFINESKDTVNMINNIFSHLTSEENALIKAYVEKVYTYTKDNSSKKNDGIPKHIASCKKRFK